MKVVISRHARTDLIEIGQFIAEHNPRRAETLVKDLFAKARSIGLRPKAYSLAPGFEEDQVRRRIHGDYLIFFTIGPDAITVTRVIHGSRDFVRILSSGKSSQD